MNVLSVGAGLVGCNFAREMTSRGHRVVLYDAAPNHPYIQRVSPGVPVIRGDMRDLAAVIDAVQAHRIDTAFVSAFLIGQTIAEHPFSGVLANVAGPLTVMEALRLAGGRKMVFAGTQGVYQFQPTPPHPIREDHPTVSGHFYMSTKLACEELLTTYAAHYDIEFATTRFAQVYGYGHYLGGDLAGPALHDVLVDALAGRPVSLDPGVLDYNDYVYAKDVAQGVANACEQPLKSTLYNLGSGAVSSGEDVANAIREAAPGVDVQMLNAPVVGPFWVHEQRLDNTRAADELGYKPRYSLVEGVAEFVDDLKQDG